MKQPALIAATFTIVISTLVTGYAVSTSPSKVKVDPVELTYSSPKASIRPITLSEKEKQAIASTLNKYGDDIETAVIKLDGVETSGIRVDSGNGNMSMFTIDFEFKDGAKLNTRRRKVPRKRLANTIRGTIGKAVRVYREKRDFAADNGKKLGRISNI